MQRTKAEAESAESSKEADNPSPVSVLEVTLRDGDVLSCPESFDQVSADLQGTCKPLAYYDFLDYGNCGCQKKIWIKNKSIICGQNVKFLDHRSINNCNCDSRSD